VEKQGGLLPKEEAINLLWVAIPGMHAIHSNIVQGLANAAPHP